jgi:hypothetical protein
VAKKRIYSQTLAFFRHWQKVASLERGMKNDEKLNFFQNRPIKKLGEKREHCISLSLGGREREKKKRR